LLSRLIPERRRQPAQQSHRIRDDRKNRSCGHRFKPPAAGRSYMVEVAAIDDSGAAQGFDPAGTVTVR
jgi:hypothetical protein